jgi:hypothetical protein
MTTAGFFGCSSEPAATDEEHYAFCADDYTKSEFVKFLDGNLVVVAAHVEHGVSAGSIVGGLVFDMVLNGIDFSNLDYEPRFSNGDYELTNGDFSLGFRLFFIETFDEHAAGDVVPYNLFDPESYVQNLVINDIDLATGRVSYDYDPGPAAHLVDGEVEIDVDDPTDVSIRVRIRATLLAFEAFSEGTHHGRPPRQADDLHIVMTTTQAPLLEVYEQFLAGEYGFRYTGTRYDSVHYGLDQVFTDSLFLMGSDGDDGWIWTGDYRSTVQKGDMTAYQSGFISNLDQNTTEYYCDEALEKRVGVARHRLDLLGGQFAFEDGTKVPYSISPY